MAALGVAMVLVLALPVGVLFLLSRVERSMAGTCGRENPVSARPALDRRAVAAYEEANVALLARVDEVLGSHDAPTHATAPQCPTNPDTGGVVGVTSRVRYAMPSGRSRCDVVRVVEASLRADGWFVWSIETEVAGTGVVGTTDAWRDGAWLTMSVQADRRLVEVGVDHASDRPAPDLPRDLAPPCRE